MKLQTFIMVAGTVAVGCGIEPSGPPRDTENGFDLTCNVPTGQIFFGGVARDGIPALTNPQTVVAGNDTRIADSDRILGIVVNGVARAYPFGVLWWHEVVNDTVGGEPVLVTYCPLTGSGIAFDPRADGGAPRSFGVSGLLFENNLIMFDNETETLWNQMLLGSTCGPDRGLNLSRLPIVETTWGHWKQLHPATTVMTFNTGFLDRSYGIYPYDDYRDVNNSERSLPGSPFSNLRPPKELALGIFVGDEAVALPFGILDQLGSFGVENDSVAGLPFVAVWDRGAQSAIPFDRRVDGQTLTFSIYGPGQRELQDSETGSIWNELGVATSGPLAGKQLKRVADAYVAFWFAWSIFYPDIRIID